MNFKTIATFVILLISIQTNAQISDAQQLKIDSLFVEWNQPNHPGGAIGIMKDGKTVFSKSYGLASLEYLVPNSTETIFNTGSVSKQFTAMGIVRLHEQGKLSVDDDIRKHLPELPDFGEVITIRHMLHHTSGLRSLHAMLELAGWRGDDSRTNEDLNRFLLKQRDLNFKPGEENLYCNTGYMLMVNIIEKVTEEKFRDWMKKSIFEPLGMIHTYVEDNYSRIVPNNATSYYNSNPMQRAVEYWGYVGSGNAHSTTNDLLKWLANFHSPQSNWETSFKLLQTLDPLNNGSENNYAFGVVIDQYGGAKRIQHGGAIGGFRAYVCSYPDQQLNIAVLTNFSAGSPGQKASQISEILLEKTKIETSKKVNNTHKPITLSKDQLNKFEASYWNDKDTYARKIYLKNDTLRYARSASNESFLSPIGQNEFQMMGVGADVIVKFELAKNGEKTMIVLIDSDPPIISKAFTPSVASTAEMKSYTGTFYSPELETTYTVFMKDEKLKWHHARHGDYDIKILKADILEGDWPFNIIKYKRDKNGTITGILVSNGRVKNCWFEKQ